MGAWGGIQCKRSKMFRSKLTHVKVYMLTFNIYLTNGFDFNQAGKETKNTCPETLIPN